MRKETGEFKAVGGTSLYYQTWRNSGARGGLVFVHGLGEHSSRYDFPVRFFTQKGYSVYLYDQRGHGQSGGRRGHADSWDQLIGDLDRFLTQVVRSQRPPILVGHSFGGQVAINYAASPLSEGKIRALVLSSPNVRVALPIPRVKRMAAGLLSRWLPGLPLGNEVVPEYLSHDPQVVEGYKNDPLVVRKVTTRLGDLILKNQEEMEDLARAIQVPCLLMHGGEDRICSPEGTRDFFNKIPVEDKELKIYEGFCHELFNEVGREQVFHDLQAWIERHP